MQMPFLRTKNSWGIRVKIFGSHKKTHVISKLRYNEAFIKGLLCIAKISTEFVHVYYVVLLKEIQKSFSLLSLLEYTWVPNILKTTQRLSTETFHHFTGFILGRGIGLFPPPPQFLKDPP